MHLLKNKNVPEKLWDKCFIKDGQVYLPSGDKSAEEVYQDTLKQIDICHEEKPKSLEEQVQDLQKEKEHLWETVQFLLKKTGMIGDEKDATN